MSLDGWAELASYSEDKPDSNIGISSEQNIERVDAWTGIDKLKHFSVSLVLTTSSYYYMKKPVGASNTTSLSVSIPFSLLVGLGKEFKDRNEKGNHFCIKDLTVDIMGIASGWFIVNSLR